MIVQSMLLQALGPEDLFRVLRIPPFAGEPRRKVARRPTRLVTA